MRGCILYILFGVFAATVCLGLAGMILVRSYDFPSAAMEPTLKRGERLLYVRSLGLGAKRGDLVTFNLPSDINQISVRRVVGLPGDRIQVRGGTLILNGRQVYEPYIQAAPNLPGADFPGAEELVFYSGEVLRLQSLMYGEWVKNGVLTVPENYYFVLSDNRKDVLDSRNYGPVPKANVIARPFFVYASSAGTPHFVNSYRTAN
jgi:signal peptidase I